MTPVFLSVLLLLGPTKPLTPRQQIEAAYKCLTSAFIAKDFAKFESFMTLDFKGSAEGGTPIQRDAVVSDFKAMRQRLTDVKWTKNIESLVVTGKTAVAKVSGTMSSVISQPDKKTSKFELKATSEDHWLNTAAGWKLKSSDKQHVQVFLNGTPIRHQ